MWLSSYDVEVNMGSLIESRGVEGAVVSSSCLPGAMIVIAHDANEIHLAREIETSDLDFHKCPPVSPLGKDNLSAYNIHAFSHTVYNCTIDTLTPQEPHKQYQWWSS